MWYDLCGCDDDYGYAALFIKECIRFGTGMEIATVGAIAPVFAFMASVVFLAMVQSFWIKESHHIQVPDLNSLPLPLAPQFSYFPSF